MTKQLIHTSSIFARNIGRKQLSGKTISEASVFLKKNFFNCRFIETGGFFGLSVFLCWQLAARVLVQGSCLSAQTSLGQRAGSAEDKSRQDLTGVTALATPPEKSCQILGRSYWIENPERTRYDRQFVKRRSLKGYSLVVLETLENIPNIFFIVLLILFIFWLC